MKAIETYYNGNRFRSRLEARWAAFMDALSVGYRYELEGYEMADGLRYLPDFYIPAWDAFLEIKPSLPNRAEILKAQALVLGSGKAVNILFGECRDGHYDAWRWVPKAGAEPRTLWQFGLRWIGRCECDLTHHLGPLGYCECMLTDGPAESDLFQNPGNVRTWQSIQQTFRQVAEIRFEFRGERHDVA